MSVEPDETRCRQMVVELKGDTVGYTKGYTSKTTPWGESSGRACFDRPPPPPPPGCVHACMHAVTHGFESRCEHFGASEAHF